MIEMTILRRIPQLLAGLVVFGAGLGLVVTAGNGQGPWTVFHEGAARYTPLSIGAVIIVTGAVLVAGMVMVREPIGLGTLVNVAVVGVATDITLALVERPDAAWSRAAMTLAAPLLVALGSGLYLGVRLGPGPRDGVMTALDRLGVSIWKARFGIEVVPFVIGVALGGTIGWGTVYWLAVIGPAVQIAVGWFGLATIETRWTDVLRARPGLDRRDPTGTAP